MLQRIALFLILLNGAVFPGEQALSKAEKHLFLKDPRAAFQELEKEEGKEAEKLKIRSLLMLHREREALEAFCALYEQDSSLEKDANFLREMCFALLEHHASSSQYATQTLAFLGATYTQDVKALSLIKERLNSTNAHHRTLAIEMACRYQDPVLKKSLPILLKEEKVWQVRLCLLKAIGQLRLFDERGYLEAILTSDLSMEEERCVAIEALIQMYEGLDEKEFRALVNSKQAGMRRFACSLADYFYISEAEEAMIQLSQDPHPGVRKSALNYWQHRGSISSLPQEWKRVLLKNIEDPHLDIAMQAALVCYFIDPKKATDTLEKGCLDSNTEKARLAAMNIASLGGYGKELSEKLLKVCTDPFVRINLALGLLRQQAPSQEALDALYHFFQEVKQPCMWLSSEDKQIVPSRVRHGNEIYNLPKLVDQLTRLELLSYLASYGDERASSAMQLFLEEHSWHLSTNAGLFLLQEKGPIAREILVEYLEHSDPELQLQAALILALFTQDDQARVRLEEAYETASRERRLAILEALSQIQSPKSLSFFLKALKAPSPCLRIVAAFGVIRAISL